MKKAISDLLSLEWIPFIFIPLGLFLILPSQNEIDLAREARNWKEVKAKISISKLQRGADGGQILVIEGTILSTNQRFKTSRVCFGEIGTRSKKIKYLKRFPRGAVVDVYISPLDSSNVILINSNSLSDMYLLQSIGIFLIFISLIPVIIKIIAKKKRRAK